jgi:hypothetical protein
MMILGPMSAVSGRAASHPEPYNVLNHLLAKQLVVTARRGSKSIPLANNLSVSGSRALRVA